MTGHTALYARVSTADQSLNRQKEETWTYAVKQLDVPPTSIEVYEDTGTGRDTQRDGYQELIADVRAGDVDRARRAGRSGAIEDGARDQFLTGSPTFGRAASRLLSSRTSGRAQESSSSQISPNATNASLCFSLHFLHCILRLFLYLVVHQPWICEFASY